MTKKDYVLIAEVLRSCTPAINCEQGHRVGHAGACISCDQAYGEINLHAKVCTDMADALAKENPLFSRIKFMEEINK